MIVKTWLNTNQSGSSVFQKTKLCLNEQEISKLTHRGSPVLIENFSLLPFWIHVLDVQCSIFGMIFEWITKLNSELLLDNPHKMIRWMSTTEAVALGKWEETYKKKNKENVSSSVCDLQHRM